MMSTAVKGQRIRFQKTHELVDDRQLVGDPLPSRPPSTNTATAMGMSSVPASVISMD